MPKSFDQSITDAVDTFETYSNTFFVSGMTIAERITKNQPVMIKLAACGVFGVTFGTVGRGAGLIGGAYTFFFNAPAFNKHLEENNKNFISARKTNR